MSAIPSAPECDRLAEVAPVSQKIGEFLDWLSDAKGIHLAEWIQPEEWEWGGKTLVTVNVSFSSLLAEFFEIDLDKVEAERRAILQHLREQT